MNPDTILHLLGAIRRCTGELPEQAEIEAFFRENGLMSVAASVLLLAGCQPPMVFTKKELQHVILEKANLPEWLLAACKGHTGNLGEVLALIAFTDSIEQSIDNHALATWFQAFCDGNLVPLKGESFKESLLNEVLSLPSPLTRRELMAMISGEALKHPPLSALHAALQSVFRISPFRLAWMLRHVGPRDGDWIARACDPGGELEFELPFSQLAPIPDIESISISSPNTWLEPFHRGVHCQLHAGKRGVMLWSRDFMDLTAAFPEITTPSSSWTDQELVFEGVLVPADQNTLGPTACLSARMQSKNPQKEQARNPVSFLIFDLLQIAGKPLRKEPLKQRRAMLEKRFFAFFPAPLQLLPILSSQDVLDCANKPIEEVYPRLRGWVFKDPEALLFEQRTISNGMFLEAPVPNVLAILTSIRPSQSSHPKSDLVICTFALMKNSEWLPVAHIECLLPKSIRAKIIPLITSRFGNTHTLSPSLLARISYHEALPNPRSKAGLLLHRAKISEWLTSSPPAHASPLEALRSSKTTVSPIKPAPSDTSSQLLLFGE